MKYFSQSIMLVSSLMALSTASAQQTFFGTLDDDVVYNGPVLLQGVTASSDTAASILLEGSGTLTVTNASGGGFPRLMVVGETTISSERSFAAEEINKTSWSGQFEAPTSSVKPDFFDITDPGAGFADDYEAVEAYGMGLANETFKFSNAAEAVFPVSASNGQKLYVADEQTDGTWTVDKEEFCIVDNNLCFLEITEINNIALIKEKFDNCPVQNIANGSVGGAPNCVYSCSSGFKLNEEATGCEEAGGVEAFENQFEETTEETSTAEEQAIFENQIAAPVKEYDFPPGHFRYRASSENFYRYLDTEGVEGEVYINQNADPNERNVIDMQSDAGRVRAVNNSYLSRNPRSAEEQLMAQNTDKSIEEKQEEESDFMSYLISMRNYFGENAQENNYTAMSAEGGEASDAEASAEGGDEESTGSAAESGEEGGAFLSSGAMLPSTGPGLFITIAVVGFALMMFGARRS